MHGLVLWVWCSGFGVEISGLRVDACRFKKYGPDARCGDSKLWDSGFRVQGSGFRVWDSGFRVQD